MNYQKIKLVNGLEINLDLDSRFTACKRCKKPIKFGITALGKYIPIIQKDGGWETHFADCEFADSFRKGRIEEHVEDQQKNERALSEL